MKKYVEVIFLDSILTISFLIQGLEDMLLVLSDQLGNLNEHLFLTILIYKLVSPN